MSSNLIINKEFDVLIVEDEPILAMAIKLKLKKFGLNVSNIASSPNDAILYAQNNYPDLAIVDINLNSSKTGIEVANYLWKNFNIPIIFLTSYYNDKILSEAMEAEPYAYLLKPCRNEELKVAINTAMHKHQYFFKNKKVFKNKENDFVYLKENIKYNKTTCELFIDDNIIKLTKNEKKLFYILTKEAGKVINFDTIFNFIWREDVYDLSKLRSLIYRLKNKLGFNPFENLYEEGYRVNVIKKNI
ncbi:DNA-binding response regulator [Malaciobacter canalis]|uniref:DNA-binding response regulator n=1 Tax=Malaciobacter canalis TaxID=1912871 RepID=A0ABX4LS84_9BACT|nr:response regulator [Malaciobacter canalis]PHO10618.1 DNA-binding response regulator [Malaciobacter canalis]QEE32066.1 two-component system response regulator [Malaciobacter canalis]